MNMPSTLLLSSLLLSIPARSQSRDLRKLVPSESFGYVQFAGIKACSKAAKELPIIKFVTDVLGKLPRDLFMAEFEADLDQGREEIREALTTLGLDPADLAKVLERPIVISFGRPTFVGPILVPSMLLAIDIEGVGDALTQVLATIESVAGVTGGARGLKLSETSLGAMKITIFEHKKFPGRISLARGNGYLMLGVGKHYFAKALDCLHGKGKSLRVPDKLKKPGANVSPLLSYYLDTRPFLDWIEPFVPYEIKDVAKVIGLGGIDGIYYSSWVEQGQLRDFYRLGFRGNKGGLLQNLLTGPNDSKAAELCSDDCLFFASAKLKPEVLLASIKQIRAMLPEDIKKRMRVPQQAKAVLSLLGPEVAIALQLPKTMPGLPELRLFFSLRDEQKARATLEQALEQWGEGRWKSRESDGTIMYYGPKPRIGPLVIMPAIVIKNGMLIVGSQMRDLRRDLKAPVPFEKSLANNPSFASNLKRSGSPSAFVHLGLKSNIAAAWKLARPFAIAGLDSQGLGEVDLDAILPDPDAIANALVNPSFAFRVDDKGFECFGQDNLLGGAAVLSYFGHAIDYFFQGFRGKIR